VQFECPVKKRWMNVRKGTVSEYVLKIAESKNPKARIPMRNMPMVLARVVGTVVSTRKEPKIEGIKFLLLEKINPETFEGKKDYVVAMDRGGQVMQRLPRSSMRSISRGSTSTRRIDRGSHDIRYGARNGGEQRKK